MLQYNVLFFCQSKFLLCILSYKFQIVPLVQRLIILCLGRRKYEQI